MANTIKQFITEVLSEGKFDGCWYYNIDDEYSLVFAWGLNDDNEDSLYGKIAVNTDDLKSDYDWDWDMPTTMDGEVIYTEISDCQTYSADELCKEFKSIYSLVTE